MSLPIIERKVETFEDFEYNWTNIVQYNNPIELRLGQVHLPKDKKQYGRRLDVGIDGNDYSPYLLTDIVKMMENVRHTPEIIGDHH